MHAENAQLVKILRAEQWNCLVSERLLEGQTQTSERFFETSERRSAGWRLFSTVERGAPLLDPVSQETVQRQSQRWAGNKNDATTDQMGTQQAQWLPAFATGTETTSMAKVSS